MKELREKRATVKTSGISEARQPSPQPGPSAPRGRGPAPTFNEEEVEKREDSSSSSPYFVYKKPNATSNHKVRPAEDSYYSCAYYARVRTVKGVAIKWHTSAGFRAVGKKPRMYEAQVSGETTIGSSPTSSVTTMRQDIETRSSKEDPCEIKMEEITFQVSQSVEEELYEDPSEDKAPGPSHRKEEERPRVATPDWLVTTDKGFRCLACCRVFLTLEALMEHARCGIKEGFSCRVFNEAMLEMRCNQEKKRETRWRQTEVRRQLETWQCHAHNWRHGLETGHHQDIPFNQAQARHRHQENWHRQAQARHRRIQTRFNPLRAEHRQQESQHHQRETQFNQLLAQYHQQESHHHQVQNQHHRLHTICHRREGQIQQGLNRCHQLETWNNQTQAWRRRLEAAHRYRKTQLQQAEVRRRRLEAWCHQAQARNLRLEAERRQRQACHLAEAQHHHRETQHHQARVRHHQLESIHHQQDSQLNQAQAQYYPFDVLHHRREARLYPSGVWHHQLEIRRPHRAQGQHQRIETTRDQQEAQLHQAAEDQHRARETHRHQARAQRHRSVIRRHQVHAQRR
ncbi:uncharacterized protein LOC144454049 [Phascolarctos cinereus]|uniref:Protein FAM170B-like n=1 Tax=Phascolarctos cinereus TaxID=38626 RepID=A0A6P5K531_PHACI|nr:protein FAM170B-like [Phascolarctos cinereus]